MMHTLTFWSSLLMIFIIPWQNMVSIPGVGTVAKGVGLLMAACWVVKVTVTGKFRKSHPFNVAMYLFVLWNTISLFWTIDLHTTMRGILTYFQLAFMMLIIWDLYTTSTALKAGLQAYVLGAYISVYSLMNSYMAAGGPNASYIRRTNLSTGNFNLNDLAMILTLGIPIAWYLVISAGKGRKANILMIVNGIYIPAALWAVTVTGSRGALVALIPVVLFMLGSFTQLKFFLRVLIFSALIGSLFYLQSFVPKQSFERLAGTKAEITEGDFNGRLRTWREGYDVFLEHPLLGIGSRAFDRAVDSGKSAHNFILEVLVNLGIIGFGLFAILLFITIQEIRRHPKLESRFWYSIFLTWMINASTHNFMTQKFTWLFLVLAVVSANVSIRRDRAVRVYVRSVDPTRNHALEAATHSERIGSSNAPLAPRRG